MADIGLADTEKLKFRILVSMLTKSGGIKRAHKDMRNCSNLFYRGIYLEIMKAASGIDRGHQRNIVADLGTWLLWTVYKDTAYNPIALYIVKKALAKPEIIDSVNELGVDDIKDLYVNRWSNTMKTTAKKQENNLLPKGKLSESEKTFVPNVQHNKHLDMATKALSEDMISSAEKESKKIFRQR